MARLWQRHRSRLLPVHRPTASQEPPTPPRQRHIPLGGHHGAQRPSVPCCSDEASVAWHVPSAAQPVLPAQPSLTALSAPPASFRLRRQTRAAPGHRGRGPAGNSAITLTRKVGLKPSPSHVLLTIPATRNLERRHQSKFPDGQGMDCDEGERIRQVEKFFPTLAPSSSWARSYSSRLSSPRRP